MPQAGMILKKLFLQLLQNSGLSYKGEWKGEK